MTLIRRIYADYFLSVVISITCVISVPVQLAAQNEKPTVGIVVRPIIPSSLFTNTSLETDSGGLRLNINARPAFGFGGVIRQGLGRVFSLESGIYYTRRNYTAQINAGDSFSVKEDFAFVDYEIPLMGLIYIRLSDRFYLNNAFGLTLDFFPNDLEKRTDDYKLFGLRKYWVLPGLEAMTGIEYRTPKKGFFYLGASYHRMLVDMGAADLVYQYERPTEKTVIATLAGHYFALEFKYFFSNERYAPPIY